MGSLWGHIDEGIFFMGISIWWIYNMFRDYIQCKNVTDYKSKLSYATTIRGRQIPMEIFVKIFGIFGGFMIEVVSANWRFIDDDGEFKSVSNLQHMSIYMLFMLHVIVDLCQFYKLLIIPGLDYMTAFVAFFWYGTVFFFHSFMNDMLEKLIHCVGIVICFGAAFGMLWEYGAKDVFVPNYFRNLMILTLGTWFTHTPFFLFSTKGMPGTMENPSWNRDSMINFEFAATMLGIHLFVNLCITIFIYLMVRLCHRCEAVKPNGIKNGGLRLLSKEGPDEEKGRLLDSGDEEEIF